jgi:hypothetical protein
MTTRAAFGAGALLMLLAACSSRSEDSRRANATTENVAPASLEKTRATPHEESVAKSAAKTNDQTLVTTTPARSMIETAPKAAAIGATRALSQTLTCTGVILDVTGVSAPQGNATDSETPSAPVSFNVPATISTTTGDATNFDLTFRFTPTNTALSQAMTLGVMSSLTVLRVSSRLGLRVDSMTAT